MNARLSFAGYGGLSLAAEAFGAAEDPAVVLLHGGAQDRGVWRETARTLAAAGRYAITLDLRGHGDSDWARDGRYDLEAFAEDLRAVLAQLPTRPVVIGASLGGYVALAALDGRGAALASGLVLVDAATSINEEGRKHFGELLRRQARGFADLEEAALAAQELSPRHAPADPAALERRLRRDEHGRYFWMWDPRFLTAFEPEDLGSLEHAASELKLPTLLMHGAQSDVVAKADLERFQALAKGVEYVAIEQAGHLLARDQTDAFNAALLEFLERRAPRAPVRYEVGSDARTLRDALGCFGTGVVVATTLDADGQPQGITANSFTSVSLDPPLILVCIAKTSRTLPAFAASETFAVNVLHIGQQPDSMRFAKRAEDRFSASAWEAWQTGSPILKGSLASIECIKHSWSEAGDHVILIGQVQRAMFEPHRDPLLYFRGSYRRLHFL